MIGERWRPTSPPSQVQFDSTKFNRRYFSCGSWCSNSFWAFRASSRSCTPSRLVAGRERVYLDRFWNEFSANPARFSEAAHELPSEPRVGTSDATAPGRIEIGPEETGSGPTWSPPFQWAAADFCSVNAPLTAAASRV